MMKLRKPWSTRRLKEAAPSVTVFLLEEYSGKWRPVVERHANCRGADPHDDCTVLQRFVGPEMDTREAAEAALASVDQGTRRGMKKPPEMTFEEREVELTRDPAGMTLDELAMWINALDDDIAAGVLGANENMAPGMCFVNEHPGAELTYGGRLESLRYEMHIRTAPRPIVGPPLIVFPDHITYHLGPILCDEGENPGVLSVTAGIHPSPFFPDSARLFVGAPQQSPLMEGYIPSLGGGFGMSVETAERLISVLQRAIRDVRRATTTTTEGDRHGKEG